MKYEGLEKASEVMIMEEKIRTIFCLIERDAQTRRILARCLNYDLIASADSVDEAWMKLKDIIKAHLEHCRTAYPEGLSVTADQSVWQRYTDAVQRGCPVRTEKLDLRIQNPSESDSLPVWMQGITSDSTSPAYVS